MTKKEDDKKSNSIWHNPKQEFLKKRREVRRAILGEEGNATTGQRFYSEKTKTRRAVKTELFGNQGKGSDTSIEIWAEEVLTAEGFKFTKQKAIRWCNYDFYLHEQNVLIEINGDYFHINPRLYSAPKNLLQRENQKKNEAKAEIARLQNIPLIIVWELDIKKDPEKTKRQLLKFIAELTNKGYSILETNYEEKE